jgi:hypothetical protein
MTTTPQEPDPDDPEYERESRQRIEGGEPT